jgi:hypothetical protein
MSFERSEGELVAQMVIVVFLPNQHNKSIRQFQIYPPHFLLTTSPGNIGLLKTVSLDSQYSISPAIGTGIALKFDEFQL